MKIILIFVFSFALNAGYERFNYVVKYDKYFKKYSKRYFGLDFDWLLFKSQAIAESNLNPEAKSHVGAEGLMQIMPFTWKEISHKLKINADVKDVKWNIAGGIYYNRRMFLIWKGERPLNERIDFMFASYNAGAGNIIKAQKLVVDDDPMFWSSVAKVLNQVTGRHSKETVNYVKRIKKIRSKLGAGIPLYQTKGDK